MSDSNVPDRLQPGVPDSDLTETYASDTPEDAGSSTSDRTRFRILYPHAAGGLGQVSVALDEELHREVALKEIQPQHAGNSASRERFVLEAEITGGLEHPGVVPVYGMGQYADGRPYYAMRFIKGDSLKATIEAFHRSHGRDDGTRQLEFRKLLMRFIDVCNAMEYAHSRGVIHRDLKPSNIMLGKYGETLVVDWGLAKTVGRQEIASDEATITPSSSLSTSGRTRPGSALGTPAYMSPEQALGQLEDLGPATDIYGLGATLYHLITGKPPFEGPIVDVLRRVQNGELRKPSDVAPEVVRDLEAICLKAMAREPGNRYSSARKLADDIEHWLADEPVSARRETQFQRLGRFFRRHRSWVTVSGGALVVIAIVSTTAAFLYDVQRRKAVTLAENESIAKENAQAERQRAELAADEEAKARLMAQRTIVDLNTTMGLVADDHSEPQTAALWFAQAIQLAEDNPERQLAARLRFEGWRQSVPYPVRAFPTGGPSLRDLAFSPCGRYLAAILVPAGCQVWNLETGAPLPLGEILVKTISVEWNSTGDRLALGTSGGQIEIFSFPAAERIFTLERPGRIMDLEFSRNGRLLAVGANSAWLWDTETHEFFPQELAHPQLVMRVAFNAAGDRLATACIDQQLRVFDVSATGPSGIQAPLYPPLRNVTPSGNLRQLIRPVFLDNDRSLLSLFDERHIAVIEATTGTILRKIVAPHQATISGFVSSPDEQSLLINGHAAATLVDFASGRERIFIPHKSGVFQAVFSPDGDRILTVGSDHLAQIGRTNADTEESVPTPIPHQNEIHLAAFSRDGVHFATAQTDGLIRVWSNDHPVVERRLAHSPTEPRYVRLSADGTHALCAAWSLSRGDVRTCAVPVNGDALNGAVLQSRGALNDAAFSPNGQHAVTLSSSATNAGQKNWTDIRFDAQPGWVQFWDWHAGTEILEPLELPAEPLRAEYSPNGETLVVACADATFHLIDPRAGKISKTIESPVKGERAIPGAVPGRIIKFTPRGDAFATWGIGQEARIWDVTTGTLRWRFENVATNRQRCSAMDFSRTGNLIAVATNEGKVKIWNSTSPADQPIATLLHPDWVFGVSFDDEGEHVLTACRDGAARLWHWPSGQTVGPSLEHPGECFAAAFSGDGRWILTIDNRETFRIWDPATGKPVIPPKRVPGGVGQIELTPDGRVALVPGSKVHAFDLAKLLNPADSTAGPEGDVLLGEILSSRRISDDGSGVVKLTTAEWLERWERLPPPRLNLKEITASAQ